MTGAAQPANESGFIVHVPEAEACVAALRRRFDAAAAAGVPAHITLLYPFMPPEHITPDVTRKVGLALAAAAPFAFTLQRVERFPATAYLAPDPAAPFIALTAALVRAFSGYPPYGGEHEAVIPHLTVANGDASDAAAAAAELGRIMQSHGPLHCTCDAVTLLERVGVRWRVRQVFAL